MAPFFYTISWLRAIGIAIPAIALFHAALSPLAAQTQRSDIDVRHYEARLGITPATRELGGAAFITVRNTSASPLGAIPLDLTSMTVSAVKVGGQEASFQYDQVVLTVDLQAALAPNDSVLIEVAYTGSPTTEPTHIFGGCHWGETSYFMGVGFSAPSVSLMRYWLPSNDVPNDKASFDVTFTVPEGLVVAGTGLLTEQTSENGFSRFRWVETHPTATYLFTYAISDYVLIEDNWNGIPLQYYVHRIDSTRGTQYFHTVPGMMEAFTNAFGPYPFDKVGYCITPIGSMEHQTMISYDQSLFRVYSSEAGETAAHELGHMWWGDWVTCDDFGDAWLSEGFAEFSEMVWAEHKSGASAYLTTVRSASQSYRTSVVPAEGMLPLHDFPRTPPSSNYPSTIYKKGAMVLVMLRDVMGDQAFFDGLKEYGRRHAYATATTESFQSVMEEFYNGSLGWFFDQWVFKPGYPVYQFERVIDNTGAALRIRLSQTHDTLLYPLYAMPMDVAIILTSGDTLRRRIDSPASAFEEFTFTDVPANTVQGVVLDPRGVVLKRVVYRTVGVEDATNAIPYGIRIEAVYPNPADGEVAVRIHSKGSTSLRLALYDASGRLVLRRDCTPPSGSQTLRFETSSLPGGAYTLVAVSSSGTAITRLNIR